MSIIATFFAAIGPHADYSLIVSALSVLRLTLMLIFFLLVCGLAIQVFRVYQINYLYIFELDP